jgi:restriction system protein
MQANTDIAGARIHRSGLVLHTSLLRKLLSRALNGWRLSALPEHRRRVAASRKVLRTLRGFNGENIEARVFAYLRKIDPLVYEEVVLSALEDAGAVVLRNRRYAGDGGIDGRCWLPGNGRRTFAVQCKRYGCAVTPAHVESFCRQVRDGRHAGGLFVHCGRTGPASYIALRGTVVQLISGEPMLNLLLHARLE